ncbi:uncharacterized protein LOC132181593 [Corylus avellana]|uniref:uncharacterized protein LOC132181593 n=1 Tax=Corylus avellana TaxID=13451 RepID=UPI00286CBD43|nr:uncharacterized protein LOC132181593 [Corylus avellana]
MAEGVLFDTATNIIKSLGPLIRQEIGLLWGFKDEVQKIRNTVSTIQAELLDAEEQQDNNHAVKDWLEKLKDVMYDVDDLLDDYSTKLLRQQVMTRDKKMAKQTSSGSLWLRRTEGLLFISHDHLLICFFRDQIALLVSVNLGTKQLGNRETSWPERLPAAHRNRSSPGPHCSGVGRIKDPFLATCSGVGRIK